jgi:hypothetical protein
VDEWPISQLRLLVAEYHGYALRDQTYMYDVLVEEPACTPGNIATILRTCCAFKPFGSPGTRLGFDSVTKAASRFAATPALRPRTMPQVDGRSRYAGRVWWNSPVRGRNALAPSDSYDCTIRCSQQQQDTRNCTGANRCWVKATRVKQREKKRTKRTP